MAALPPNKPWGWGINDLDSEIDLQTEEYAIGGRMITAKIEISAMEQMHMDSKEWRMNIRQRLANQLSLAMLDMDLVETTSFQDPGLGRTTIAARCYLAPNGQAKPLRVHKR